jgi:hypothetical protein
MGGGKIVPHRLKTKRNKTKFQASPIFSLKKSHMAPLFLLIIVFSKIQYINGDRDGFMCRSWAKMLKFISLSLRLSGIKFCLVRD